MLTVSQFAGSGHIYYIQVIQNHLFLVQTLCSQISPLTCSRKLEQYFSISIYKLTTAQFSFMQWIKVFPHVHSLLWWCIVLQCCGGGLVLSLPCVLAFCAADPWLLLPSCRETSSSCYDEGESSDFGSLAF